MSTTSSLLDEIEKFISANHLSATAFGIAVMNDSKFVRHLREGRDVRLSTQEKVRAFMQSYARPEKEGAA
jgi:hypothetical protein